MTIVAQIPLCKLLQSCFNICSWLILQLSLSYREVVGMGEGDILIARHFHGFSQEARKLWASNKTRIRKLNVCATRQCATGAKTDSPLRWWKHIRSCGTGLSGLPIFCDRCLFFITYIRIICQAPLGSGGSLAESSSSRVCSDPQAPNFQLPAVSDFFLYHKLLA